MVPKLEGTRARNKFYAPWEQMYCIEESTYDIVGTRAGSSNCGTQCKIRCVAPVSRAIMTSSCAVNRAATFFDEDGPYEYKKMANYWS